MYTVKSFPLTWKTPAGKSFAGWTPDNYTIYMPGQNIVLAQNMTLYPVYRDTVSTCEITYNDVRDQQAWKVTVNAGDSVYIDLNGGTEAYLDGRQDRCLRQLPGHALLHADVRLQGHAEVYRLGV